jgi:preprotein translocase subunit SecG
VVETGILGGALFVGLMVTAMHLIATRVGPIVSNGANLFVALIFLTLAHNAFENSLSRSTNILLLIFLISIFALGTYSRPRSLRADEGSGA